MTEAAGVIGFGADEVERARRYHRPLYAAAGADTAALLAELGYDEDARAELRTAGAIS